jgi:predicted DNA-binding ribbon-helix-helix protein
MITVVESEDTAVGVSRLVNRNITVSRGRTSMRLEPELWDALEEICAREQSSVGDVIQRVEEIGHPGGRTSAVRVHLLTYFRAASTEEGHRAAGHGQLPGTA